MTGTRSSLTALALALAVTVVAGCGGGSDGGEACSGKQGGSITIAHGSQPPALDPLLSSDDLPPRRFRRGG